jgi:hypothetical protein
MRATVLNWMAMLSLAVLAGSASAQGNSYAGYDEDNPFASNAAFWEGLDKEEEPYEHDFTTIPDLIQNETVYFWFNQTHQYLLGIERGMYGNDSYVLDEECFGRQYVERINIFAAIIKSDPLAHWILLVGIIYQIYYMFSDKCRIDQTFNDVFIYMWNNEFEPTMLWHNFLNNFLYMTRALIDAAIVWWEGVPDSITEDYEQWHALSRQTGESSAEIVKEFIGFTPQTEFKDAPYKRRQWRQNGEEKFDQ